MNKTFLVAALLLTAGVSAQAADTAKTMAIDTAAKPAVMEAEAGVLTATVEAIDYKTRSIVLKGEDGNLVSMIAGPEITRFNEIKKGDIVEAEYLVSVAVMVQSPDKTVASAEGSSTAIVRHAGKKPSGVLTQTDVVSATVVSVDAKKRKATLKGPEGNTVTVDVAADVANLENVKKGDQVFMKVTRTVALDVRKPSKKK